ncbi:hypothetical protein [Sphingomonas sp. Marseille-Q8236]
MKTIIVEARPSDANGAAVDIRLAGGGRSHYLFKGLSDWRAGIVSLPRVQASLGFGKDGFTGGAVAQVSAIGFSPAMASTRALIAGLIWNDAPITVSVSDDRAADPGFAVRLVGTVAGYSASAGRFTFTLSDMAGRLGEPLVTGTFAGTGGIEGDAAAKGRVKRRSWGRCWNVEGRVLLAAWNIYEFGDPARPLDGFDAVKDKGRPVAIVMVLWAGSIAATLEALKSAKAPDGGCAVAPSIACVKFWTQPSTLTADLRGEQGAGYVDTVPGIAAAISIAADGPPVDALAAIVAIRPDPAGLHADEANETPAQMLDRLTLRASLTWAVTADRRIALRPIAFADPVETVVFEDVERRATYAPVANLKIGWQKNHRIHSDSEISAAVLAGDVTFPDGQSLADLQPAQPGADKTADHPEAFVQWTGRPAADVVADLAQTILNVAAEMIVNGTWRAETDKILFVDGKPIRQVIEQVAVTQEGLSLFVTQLQEVNASTGTARFMFAANANGDVVGIQGVAGGKISGLSFVAGRYQFVDPNGGNAINALVYDEDDVWRLRKVEVTEIKADTVITKHLVTSSISQTRVAPVSGNISIARNASANVASVSMTKQEPDSVMKVTFFGMFQSDDDIQMTCTVEVDGTTSYPAGRINNVFDSTQSKAESTLTPFVYISDLPAGDHTFVFKVVNQEVDNIALIVKMGSAMEVLEQKRPLL